MYELVDFQEDIRKTAVGGLMHSGQLMNDLVDHMPYLTLRNLTVFPLHGLRNKEILYQMLFTRAHKVAKLA